MYFQDGGEAERGRGEREMYFKGSGREGGGGGGEGGAWGVDCSMMHCAVFAGHSTVQLQQ